jgi:hypothetical protein
MMPGLSGLVRIAVGLRFVDNMRLFAGVTGDVAVGDTHPGEASLRVDVSPGFFIGLIIVN